MPDLSHVAVLKQGVEVWNGWRQRYPELRPDLSGFRAAEIPQILWEDSSLNCHAVQFRGADFSRTNLVDANFYAQNLLEVDLTDADFTNGRLSDATLKLCTAKRALFCSANLKGAKLVFGDFEGADFQVPQSLD